MINVLNLYSGIGGNRKLWENVNVTAVENDNNIAQVYKNIYPHDTVIVEDALYYLEKHFMKFDFIWSSPPCPSHGQYRYNVGVIGKGFNPIMPDMSLYAQIIFLQHYATTCKWIVENVKPYYTPLVEPSFKLHRHIFWANFEKLRIKILNHQKLEVKTKYPTSIILKLWLPVRLKINGKCLEIVYCQNWGYIFLKVQ